MRKIFISTYILMTLILTGCLSDEKMNTTLYVESKNKIVSEFSSQKNSFGDIIQIPFVTKDTIEGVSFDVVYDKKKLELIKVTKNGLSDESLAFSYSKAGGNKIVFYDMKSKISSGTRFVVLFFRVKSYGTGAVYIKNIKTK